MASKFAACTTMGANMKYQRRKTRKCQKCGKRRPLVEFLPASGPMVTTDPSHIYRRCARCRSETNEADRRVHPRDVEQSRKYKLRIKFGLTLAGYDQMLASQGGVCAGCGGHNIEGRRLAVDHDHETGQVRGLLCDRCNRIIGSAKDSPEVLRRLAAYLEGGS